MKKLLSFLSALTATCPMLVHAQVLPHAQNPFQETASFPFSGKSAVDNLYDKLYPLYVVECGGTQRIKNGSKKGGVFGHDLIYLKNVCRDTTVPFPKIRKCAPGEKDLTSPEGGMALSLDKNFINTRYIATEGLDMMLNGEMAESEKIDQASVDQLVEKIVSSGAMKGVKLAKPPSDPSQTERVGAEGVVGTSFALRFGRNMRCVSIPINEAMLDSAIAWVNEQNEPLVTEKETYQWSLFDECVHFSHNILAAMGIGDPVKVTSNKLTEAFDLSSILWRPWRPELQLPMNEVLSTEERAGEARIPIAEEVFTHSRELGIFQKFNRFGATDGVIIWSADAHTNNELFNNKTKPVFMEIPLLKQRSKRLARVLSTPQATELEANLVAYREKLHDTLQMQMSFTDIAKGNASLATQEFKDFYQSYMEFLTRSEKNIDERLNAIRN